MIKYKIMMILSVSANLAANVYQELSTMII